MNLTGCEIRFVLFRPDGRVTEWSLTDAGDVGRHTGDKPLQPVLSWPGNAETYLGTTRWLLALLMQSLVSCDGF
jgi:hypothetical protein